MHYNSESAISHIPEFLKLAKEIINQTNGQLDLFQSLQIAVVMAIHDDMDCNLGSMCSILEDIKDKVENI